MGMLNAVAGKTKVFYVSLLVISITSLAFSENYSAWLHQSNVLVNTSSTGTLTTQTLFNFPVLIRLTSSNFTFSQAATDGKDIRFSKTGASAANVTALSYQIEQWNATTQTAAIWVKIDTVLPGQVTQGFVMYWGNASATSESNGGTVFDTASGFKAVWHMSDTTDATINANKVRRNGTTAATTPACSLGVIGNSYYLSGDSNSYMEAANSASLDVPADFTIDFWAKYEFGTYPATWQRLLCRKDSWASADGWDIDIQRNDLSNGNPCSTGVSVLTVNAWGFNQMNVVDNWIAAAWHHVAITFLGDTVSVYGDGLLKGKSSMRKVNLTLTDSVWTPDTNSIFMGETLSWFWTYQYETIVTDTVNRPANNDLPIRFGGSLDNSSWFKGKMDEVRLESKVRSADWVKLSYANQKAGQTVVTVGGNISLGTIPGKSTNVRFVNEVVGPARIVIFDMNGKMVADRMVQSGNGTSLRACALSAIRSGDKSANRASGVYLVRAITQQGIIQRSMLLDR